MAAEPPTNQIAEVLLIGGYSDGMKIKFYLPLRSSIIIPEQLKWTPFSPDDLRVNLKTHYYRLEYWTDKDRNRIPIYVYENCHNPIQLLIDKYPQPEKTYG